jgi:hypothetical protein
MGADMTIVLRPPPRFRDIQQFTQSARYCVDVGWDYLLDQLAHYHEDGLDLNPDFQRAHVWTKRQQVAYVEFVLRGGHSSRDIQTNCPHWQSGSREGPFVLVDGKQRLAAAVAFLQNELPVFGGYLYRDFTDRLTMAGPGFRWHVNDLETRAEVLQWYLDLNAGGVVHTDAELTRVRKLLEAES